MARLRGYGRVAERIPETPLRFDVAPGTVVAHAGHTVVITQSLEGSRVRVRDVATGTEQDAPVSELSGICGSLGPAAIKRRWKLVRQCTREEWRIARRRERIIRTAITDEGRAADRVAKASRALRPPDWAGWRLVAVSNDLY